MNKIDFRIATKIRDTLSKNQQREIRSLYRSAASKIKQAAKNLPSTSSSILRQQYLYDLSDQISDQITRLSVSISGMITDNMRIVSEAIVDSNRAWFDKVNFPAEGAFSYVPEKAIQSIITGSIYEGNWTLSNAIWSSNEKTQKDIRTIIAEGIAQNKGIYDIAKDLETYVDPSKQKPWDWSKAYPGTSKVVDYNAQRLARTMVAHAYQQSFILTTKPNPFVTKYQWLSAGTERTCEICEERDGQYYDKDDLPIDHPNGMCTFVAVIEQSMEDIADRIADWTLGGSDPELDIFEKHLRGD